MQENDEEGSQKDDSRDEAQANAAKEEDDYQEVWQEGGNDFISQ
jgi:hypothetical protein